MSTTEPRNLAAELRQSLDEATREIEKRRELSGAPYLGGTQGTGGVVRYPSGVAHYDGVTPPILAALRQQAQSATQLAATLGQSTDRRNVAGLRAILEQLERRGEVTRSRTGTGPWVWAPTAGAAA